MTFVGRDRLVRRMTGLVREETSSVLASNRVSRLKADSQIDAWAFPLPENDPVAGDLFNVDESTPELGRDADFLNLIIEIITLQAEKWGLEVRTGTFKPATMPASKAALVRIERMVRVAEYWGMPVLFRQLMACIEKAAECYEVEDEFAERLALIEEPERNPLEFDLETFGSAMTDFWRLWRPERLLHDLPVTGIWLNWPNRRGRKWG